MIWPWCRLAGAGRDSFEEFLRGKGDPLPEVEGSHLIQYAEVHKLPCGSVVGAIQSLPFLLRIMAAMMLSVLAYIIPVSCSLPPVRNTTCGVSRIQTKYCYPAVYTSMGAGQSTSQLHPPSRALHVLRVTPSSPASKTTIEPYFDFVVGFEGDSLSSDHNIDVLQVERIVEQHEGRTLNLLIWNSKNQHTRGTA